MDKAPQALRKRCRRLNKRRVKKKNAEYVFCWIQQNLRAEDNPIIDAAIAAGNKYKLPVVVYHALGQRYPHANDRIHKFILEGSRSLAPEVEKRGLRFICYIERPDKFEKGLVYRIAERAAMILGGRVFIVEVPGRVLQTELREDGTDAHYQLDAALLVPGAGATVRSRPRGIGPPSPILTPAVARSLLAVSEPSPPPAA